MRINHYIQPLPPSLNKKTSCPKSITVFPKANAMVIID